MSGETKVTLRISVANIQEGEYMDFYQLLLQDSLQLMFIAKLKCFYCVL